VRVALVHPHFSRSTSLERDAVLLAEGLVAQGAEVHCFCDPATRTATVPGVTFHDVHAVRPRGVDRVARLAHPLERASFARAATRRLRRERHGFDVVDVRQTAALEGDVLQVHGVVAAMQRRWPSETGRIYRGARLRAAVAPVTRPQIAVDRTIQRLQLRPDRFRRVIAVTEQVRTDLVAVHDVPPERIDVVPPPVDLERITRATPGGVRPALGIEVGAPLALFVGNGFQRKGLDALVAALADVPHVHLVVVGSGDRSAVAELLEGSELARRVHFAGGVDDPERFYAEADLLVLPTRSEPWGIPLIEAMAAGIPVVSTAVAGAARVVTEAGAGIVVADESTDSLRTAIVALVDDPELRRTMGGRGRVAAQAFGAAQHAAAVLDTYRKALDADPGRN
jgi:glycosyltransferase involved in cell wall biosynthesis